MNAKTYVEPEQKRLVILRAELWLSPLLVIAPLLVSILMIGNWYTQGYTLNTLAYDGQLLLGVLILAGNLLVDIPFLKHLRTTKPLRHYLTKRRL
jgi:hypothetical protein